MYTLFSYYIRKWQLYCSIFWFDSCTLFWDKTVGSSRSTGKFQAAAEKIQAALHGRMVREQQAVANLGLKLGETL